MPPIAIVGAMVVAGAVAGSIAKKSSSESSSNSGVDLAGASGLEQNATGAETSSLNSLKGLVDSGPGQQDVTNSLDSTRGLANLLQQYQQTGGAPSQSDINTGNSLATQLFGSQQTALDQSFTQQNYASQRLSAQLGRAQDDPILQAKLRTGYMNQQAQLDSQKGAFGANYAMQLPQQRLGYAQARTQVLGGLASQAFSNRAALLNMGSQITSQQQNFRLATADHWSNGTNTTSSGGGIGGAITGGIAGLGSGMSMGASGGFSGMMGSAAASMPMGNSPYQMQQGPWAGGYGSGSQANGYGG